MPIEFSSTQAAPPGKRDVTWLYDPGASPRPKAWAYFDLDVAVVAVSSSGTVAPGAVETIERVTTGSSTLTRTLPPATGSNAIVLGKKVDSGTGTAVYAAAGSDVIDGLASYTLVNQYQYIRLLDAAAGVWDIIGGN